MDNGDCCQVDLKENKDESTKTEIEYQTLKDHFSFIADIADYYNNSDLSDIRLKVGPNCYNAHRFVLAKSSPVFKTMLYEKSWSDSFEAEINLEERPECQAVFSIFLQYLYTAEIKMTTDKAVGVLCLADKYHVESLKKLCTEYMIEHSSSPQLTMALKWYPWALTLNLPSLSDACCKTICWNFSSILKSDDWSHLDLEFMSDFLNRSDLVVPNEFAIWEATCKWLTSDRQENETARLAKILLPHIRFSQMQVHQLYAVENSELAQNPDIHDQLSSLLSSAYRFRALCPSQPSLGVKFSQEFYHPRDYSELTVDLVRIQNAMRFGIQIDVKVAKGAVPQSVREGEWKIVYRKQSDNWSLQVYPTESALHNGEAHVEISTIVYDNLEYVLMVHREPVQTLTRGQCVCFSLSVPQVENARHMGVLIKPTAL